MKTSQKYILAACLLFISGFNCMIWLKPDKIGLTVVLNMVILGMGALFIAAKKASKGD